jgi:uncharacterized membrane protein
MGVRRRRRAASTLAAPAMAVAGDHQRRRHLVAHGDVRKVALGHALLSYPFGTGIVAVAINLVTKLAQ